MRLAVPLNPPRKITHKVPTIYCGHFVDGTVLAYTAPALPSMRNTSSFAEEMKGQEELIRKINSLPINDVPYTV